VKQHFTSILFTFQKTYEEKFPKMIKNTVKVPKIYRKITPKLKKMTKNYQKITYKTYISVTSSSSLGFIYLRASYRIQGRKDNISSKFGPWSSQCI
jgi:hypothetical protein